MKAIHWLLLGAAAVGIWWMFRRRSVVSPQYLGPVSTPAGGIMESGAAFVEDLLVSSGLAPVPPTPGTSTGGWQDTAAKAHGVLAGSTVQAACVSYGGGPACGAAGKVAQVAAELQTKLAIKAGGYAVSGAKAVGSGVAGGAKAVGSTVVSGVKKLKFW